MQATRGTVSYTYLPGDLVGSVSVTGGEWAQYGYYPDGSLQAVEWSGASGGTFGYSYRLNGQYDTITFPSGQTRSHGYDDQGRLVEIANAHPAGGLLARFGYGYDLDHATGTFSRLGQRVAMTSEVPAQGLVNAVTQYRYDPAYQLTQANYPAAAPFAGETHSWAYDAIGNRVAATVNGTTTGYTYQKVGSNPNNWQRLTSDGARSYTYDANGNTLTRCGETYGWDSENRMTSISGTASATYRYDYQGRRTSKTVGGVTTTYLYDGLNLLTETGASYLYGPGIDEPLAVTRSGAIAYYATDGLGSVILLTDATGAVTNHYAYDAWGVTRTESETVPQPLRYTARERGEVAGQYFYRARYYGTGVGRFLSEDPAFDSSNAYAYVTNDPISYSDPSGAVRWRKNAPVYREVEQDELFFTCGKGAHNAAGCTKFRGSKDPTCKCRCSGGKFRLELTMSISVQVYIRVDDPRATVAQIAFEEQKHVGAAYAVFDRYVRIGEAIEGVPYESANACWRACGRFQSSFNKAWKRAHKEVDDSHPRLGHR